MAQQRQPFPVPYGLFIVLALYAVAVVGYVWATYWNSPEYVAAEHFAQATQLLGVDDGRKVSQRTLTEAYQHYLEAARLMPRVKELHERTEAMRWRFQERGFKMEHDLQMRAEAVSALWERIQREEQPMLVVGLRDRGWQPAQLLAGPGKTFLYALPGALVIVVVWAWLRFSDRKVRGDEHEAELKKIEAEVQALDGHRSRPPKPRATGSRRGPPKR
ncbi:MAG: hypothetical protein JNK82_08060 [Myxococcaceae bacterium]|nr:hypothetical protein [Myxococcaceae bacterium]